VESPEHPEGESDRAERDRVRRDPEVFLQGYAPLRDRPDFPDFDPSDPNESFGGDLA
jgi:hypothetical protein